MLSLLQIIYWIITLSTIISLILDPTNKYLWSLIIAHLIFGIIIITIRKHKKDNFKIIENYDLNYNSFASKKPLSK